MSATERYGRIPYRVYDALEANEISLAQFTILCFLEGRAVHKKDGSAPRAAYTLGGLSDAMDWPWQTEKLRRDLHELREAGWIGFDVRQGQRTKYVIELRAARVNAVLSGSPVEVERKLTSTGGSGDDPETSTVTSFNGSPNLLSGGSDREDTQTQTQTQTQNPNPDGWAEAGKEVFDGRTEEAQKERVDLSAFDSVTRLLSILKDKDAKTESVLRRLERSGCVPADFENAREEVLGVSYAIDNDAGYALKAVKRHRERRCDGQGPR